MAERVISCHDGDTCRVKNIIGNIRSVRIAGIDAPELKQPYGVESKEQLERLILGRTVRVEHVGKSFNRVTGYIHLGHKDIGKKMVELGMAWDSPKYSKGKYTKAQKKAQKKRRGLWASGAVVAPWEFREGKRAKKADEKVGFFSSLLKTIGL